MPSSSVALDIFNLQKRFSEPAVNDLSLTVKDGEFYAVTYALSTCKLVCDRIGRPLIRAEKPPATSIEHVHRPPLAAQRPETCRQPGA